MTDYPYPSRVAADFPGIDEVYPPGKDADYKFSTLLKKFGLPVATLIIGGVVGAGVMRVHDNNVAEQRADARRNVRMMQGYLEDRAKIELIDNFYDRRMGTRFLVKEVVGFADEIIAHDNYIDTEDLRALSQNLSKAKDFAVAIGDDSQEKRINQDWDKISTRFSNQAARAGIPRLI